MVENDSERKINLTYSRAGGKAKYYADKVELFTASDISGENLRVIQEKNEWELLKETKKLENIPALRLFKVIAPAK